MTINKSKNINKNVCKIMMVILLFGFLSSTHAENLGTFGDVYPIAEENFLDFIQQKLKAMQANGEWKKIEDQFRENVKQHADRPIDVRFLSVTTEYRTWDFDPSITIPYDLYDAEGRVIAKAGTTINPLKYVRLHHELLFLDGDDPKQRNAAKHLDQLLKGQVKLILVKGSISENEKRFQKPIYFDQGGRLITKFNIQHVPALVSQNDLVLKIEEIKP